MDTKQETSDSSLILAALIVSVVLFSAVFLAFQFSRQRQGSIVLPGGITYLGPSPSPSTSSTTGSPTRWNEYTGKSYPYRFSYPATMSLGWFPNDPYDAVTVFLDKTDANANIFFRVEDLTKLKKSQYIGKPQYYAENWWKDYSWKGVKSVSPFTNAHGLKGYRAQYVDDKGNAPFDHVFFEVPGKSTLIIWIGGRLFTRDDFDKLVDSVSWTNGN